MFPTVQINTVDVVFLTLVNGALHVALFKREKEPFAGVYALPGGYIHPEEDQTAFDAALRVVKEKTGVTTPYLEQVATFSGAHRDPRGWSVSIVYCAMIPYSLLEALDPEFRQVVPVDKVRDLPFDHLEIVELAVRRVRDKSFYSSLPVHLCERQFSIPELQSVYEQVIGEKLLKERYPDKKKPGLDKVSFRRKILAMDITQQVEDAFTDVVSQRPAQLYELKPKFRRKLQTMDRALLS